jgi:urease accessory protein
MQHFDKKELVVFILLAGLPALAHAHPAGNAAPGLFAGLAHPVGGLDHLVAMVAVGLWAAQLGGRSARWLPFTFVTVMALGGMLGMAGVAVPVAEAGILLSLLVLGALLGAAIRLPLRLSVVIVGAFALCHGHAHGAELPPGVSGIGYASGFLLATATLHGLGFAAAQFAQHNDRADWLRFAGAAIVLSGLSLAV